VSRGQVIPKKIAGRAMALFRDEQGSLGAVQDECAHRRMKLSLGRICGTRLVCPYHGWAFCADGRGESPSAPTLRASVISYDCAESAGVIWIRAREGDQPVPEIKMQDWLDAGVVFNRVRAPLELVIDNFSEVEHTVTTHPDFGFDPARADEAVIQVQTTRDSIRVFNRGPAKAPPFDTRLALGIRRGDIFHSDYTLHFDPPRSSVIHFWRDGQSGTERLVKYHVLHYFVPEDRTTTNIVTFGFLRLPVLLARCFAFPLALLFRRKVRRTVNEDAFLLENLADQSPQLDSMKLSRFDPVLRLTRERLRAIYFNGMSGRIS
jgi:phenylpropionate dioxygenase-like ring-hydroxylating dioxygenase large terminal subunit